MPAVRTSVNIDSSSQSALSCINSQNVGAAISQTIIDGTEYENGASIDKLPRGTALHAARTVLIKESSSRSAPSTQQPTVNGIAAMPIATPEIAELELGDAALGNLGISGNPAESLVPEEISNNEPPRQVSNGADLARRAARRVNIWKKSEQERRGEEERARQTKQEQERKRQNHVAHVKQRRRAEIYALNAILRQLQQEKVARYIAAQQQLQEWQQQQQQQERCKDGDNLTATTVALTQVRTVGV
ncbi:unnamed protein product [Phytophthora fragariaefolia]|uniref:Unnamed protein product n=1 Tax=Phytophthora fragariaefolia TaxID=1490495 RepID=A0A9W7D3V6_9STRA|nr:unnamed protein product [Phytophthora fragariaefolia]